MSTQQHSIGRIRLAVEVSSRRGAEWLFDQSGKIVALLEERMAPIFDKIAEPGRLIRINQLVLSLGDLDENDFVRQLSKAVEREIKIALQQSAQQPAEVEMLSQKEARAAAIEQYLTKGTIPWWEQPKDWQQGVEGQLDALSPAERQRLLKKWLKKPQVLDRLSYQLSDHGVVLINEVLWAKYWKPVKRILTAVEQLHRKAPLMTSTTFQRHLQQTILHIYTQHLRSKPEEWRKTYEWFWASLAQVLNISEKRLETHFRQVWKRQKSTDQSILEALFVSEPKRGVEKLLADLSELAGKQISIRNILLELRNLAPRQVIAAKEIVKDWLRTYEAVTKSVSVKLTYALLQLLLGQEVSKKLEQELRPLSTQERRNLRYQLLQYLAHQQGETGAKDQALPTQLLSEKRKEIADRNTETDAATTAPIEDQWQLLRYFLQHGFMLTNEQISSQEALEDWLCQQLERPDAYGLTLLKSVLEEQVQVQRFNEQFSLGTQWLTFRALAGVEEMVASSQLQFLQFVLPDLFPRTQGVLRTLLNAGIDYYLKLSPAMEGAPFVAHLLEPFWDRIPLSKTTLIEELVRIAAYKEWQNVSHFSSENIISSLRNLLAKKTETKPLLSEEIIAWLQGERPLDKTGQQDLLALFSGEEVTVRSALLPYLRAGLPESFFTGLPSPVLVALIRMIAADQWAQWKMVFDDLAVLHWESEWLKDSQQQLQELAQQQLLGALIAAEGGTNYTFTRFWADWLQQLASRQRVVVAELENQYRQLAQPALESQLLTSQLAKVLQFAVTPLPEVENEELEVKLNANQVSTLYFLEHGRFRAQERLSASQLRQAFMELINNNATFLREWLQDLPPRLNIANRLLDHFPVSDVEVLLKNVLVKDWLGQGKSFLQAIQLWANQIVTGVFHWEDIMKIAIDYASTNSPVLLHDSAFLRYTLQRLTESYRLEKDTLWAHLNELQKSHQPSAVRKVVDQLLQTLTETEEQQIVKWLANEQATEKQSVAEQRIRAQQDYFLFWLRYGLFPWWKPTLLSQAGGQERETIADGSAGPGIHLQPQGDDFSNQTDLDINSKLDRDAESSSPSSALVASLTNSAAELLTELQYLWPLPVVQERLSSSLTEAARIALLEATLGAYAPFALATKALGKTTLASIGKHYSAAWHWAYTLELSLAVQEFDTQRFVERWLALLTQRSGIDESRLRTQLVVTLEKTTDSYQIRVQEVLEELVAQELPPPQAVQDTSVMPDLPMAAKDILNESEKGARPARQRIEYWLSVIRYFLQFGSLPVRVATISEEELWQHFVDLLDTQPKLLRMAIVNQLSQPAAVKRLLRHLPPPVWRRLAFAFLGQQLEHLHDLQGEWEQSLFRVYGVRTEEVQQREFYQYVLHYLGLHHQKPFQLVEFASYLVSRLARSKRRKETEIITLINEAISSATGRKYTVLPSLLPALQQRTRKKDKRIDEQQKLNEAAAEQPSIDEAIYIHNAGLVILAPFFKRFFDTLSMLEGSAFTEVAGALRAVHLLQHMASGQQETPEHLLVFNKVLCGLPINTPVPLSIEMTQKETDLVDFLFSSVIQNWEVMKNSTVENLRGAFILRDGRLTEEQDRWCLVVEPKSYDITLDYLPWTISVIQLPWMEKRIEVEWKTKA